MRFKLSPETINQGRDTQIGKSAKAQNDRQRMAGEKIADFAEAVKSGKMEEEKNEPKILNV